MARMLILLAIVAAALADNGHRALFEDFKNTYNRQYVDLAEENHRFNCFSGNLDFIDASNSNPNDHAVYGVNQFTDMCHDEFSRVKKGLKMPEGGSIAEALNATAAPLFSEEEVAAAMAGTVDWRQKGAVTPVKDQGRCGSCWAFSSTGDLEGQWFLKTGKLVGLSEEQLVDCSTRNYGCNGGEQELAFDYIKKNGGIASEASYPYRRGHGGKGKCDHTKASKPSAMVKGYTKVSQSESQIATFLSQHGPLAISVDAGSNWQNYNSGILQNCRGTQLDHAVLLVGYGTQNNIPYWIVKNSWASSWGENGYIRLHRGVDCSGMAKDVLSVQV